MSAPIPNLRCPACSGQQVEVFYSKNRLPVHSCLMLKTRREALDFPRRDLALGHCSECGFIYNTLFDSSVHDYSPDYEETQAYSGRFCTFQSELCREQALKYDLTAKTVLEIGCGKGDFLVELCSVADARGIGVDPSFRPDRVSAEVLDRLDFIADFYSEKYTHLRADYVCCRHTLEHIGPVRQFVQMIRDTLDEQTETTVFFEVPDVERILVDQAFEDIYYEHCTYFTLGSLARLFRRCGFELLDLYKGYEGQYLMIECRPGDPERGRRFDAEEDLARTAALVAEFCSKIEAKFERFRADLARYRAAGQKVVLWGSGSKAVSYLTTLGVGSDEVSWIVDINPNKHGRFLAGTGHEIVAPEFLAQYRPDVVIAMNAIYTEEIREQLAGMGLRPELTAV